MSILNQIPNWALLVAAAAVVLYPQIARVVRGLGKGGTAKVDMASHINAIATHVAVHCETSQRDACNIALDSLRMELTKPPTVK